MQTNYNHQEYEQEAQNLLERSKCYEVVLSTKDRIKCDADELWRVVEGIKSGSPVKLRQGLFNPSFYVSIVLDEKRFDDFKDKVFGVLKSNKQSLDYGSGSLQKLPQFRSIADIFSGTNLKALQSPELKRLNGNEKTT